MNGRPAQAPRPSRRQLKCVQAIAENIKSYNLAVNQTTNDKFANMNGASDSVVSSFFYCSNDCVGVDASRSLFQHKDKTTVIYIIGLLLLAIQICWFVVNDKH